MTGHIFIYGGIGTGTGEVSLKNVKAQIEQEKSASDYTVHIFSPGGDVFEGYGIYNALKNTGKKITTHIEGLCASIGTLIAFAGDSIVMNKTSEFMIHNPKIADLKGDANEIRNAADQLDKIKNILVDVAMQRAIRNGKPITKERLWDLYDKETWLNAQEAQSIGFADEVVDAIKAVATVDLKNLHMEKSTWLQEFFKSFTAKAKIKNELVKNQMSETLASGQVIVVDSDDGNWTGKRVVTETGEQLPPGDHPLVSGKILVVGEGSTITEVKEAPAAEAQTPENDEMENKIKELEVQLAEAKGARAAAEAKAIESDKAAAAATASVAKFENRMAEVEKKYLKLAEESSKTVGDNSPPPKGPAIKAVAGTEDNKGSDPMGDEALSYFRNRNISN